jgi:hypothetical protein
MAVIATVGKTYFATLMDLSATGAKLSGKSLPALGDELDLKIDRISAFGRVAWKRGGQCGIAFEVPVALADVAILRQKSTLDGFTPELRAALDDWTVGIAR